jgi:ribosomal protein S18 acetylase RimI-like enzyme
VTFRQIGRNEFATTPRGEGDRFANTFTAKADTMQLWPLVRGIMSQKHRVKAAICFRLSQRQPVVANLQLLHTFEAERHKGLATELVEIEYRRISQLAEYFRVSSEHDAVGFYRKLGLKFWGRQKSGTFLCIHRITGANPRNGDYTPNDFINGLLHSGRRGCLTETFDEPQ